jgi:hypothetical protein
VLDEIYFYDRVLSAAEIQLLTLHRVLPEAIASAPPIPPVPEPPRRAAFASMRWRRPTRRSGGRSWTGCSSIGEGRSGRPARRPRRSDHPTRGSGTKAHRRPPFDVEEDARQKVTDELPMPLIRNKTRGPLSVPLPRGKTLHLGLDKTGAISSTALDYPAVKKILDAGEIEILADAPRSTRQVGGGKKFLGSTHGHASGGVRSSGDR